MTRILSLLIVLCFSSGLHAKDFHLDDSYSLFGGGSVSLKEVIGKKPVYLKFWASWCLDCRRELPSLEQAYRTYGEEIAMFAVNLNINETEERSEEHTSELQSRENLVCRLLLEKKKK